MKQSRVSIVAALVVAALCSPASAQDHAPVVAQVKAELLAEGWNFHTVDPSDPDGSEESRCGAFEITRRTVNRLRREGLGFVAKSPGQNGCTTINGQRYSHDAVMYPDGRTFDILMRSETENIPAWNRVEHDQPPTSWRAPFDPESAPEPPPAPKPTPTPTPKPPPIDLSGLQASIDAVLQIGMRVEEKVDHVNVRQEEIAAVETGRWLQVKGVWESYFEPWLVPLAKVGGVAGLAGWVGWYFGKKKAGEPQPTSQP